MRLGLGLGVTALVYARPPVLDLLLSGPLSFAAGASAGTLVANIGNVPAGATPILSPDDGRLAIAGNASAGWKVVVGLGTSSAGDFDITVSAAGAKSAIATVSVIPALSISGSPGGTVVGNSTVFTPKITGGTPPYSLSLLSGSLPAGRALTGNSITGTYTTAASYTFTLRVTDAANATADLPLTEDVQPAVLTATYDFSQANGTKLSAIPNWKLVLGDDALETNAGILRKLSSTTAIGLYTERGAGRLVQQVECSLGVSGSTFVGCFTGLTNGAIDGYFIRKSSATNVRLMRYNAGAVANLITGFTIAGTGPLKMVVDATNPAQVAISVYENGSLVPNQTWPYIDSTNNRLNVGKVGIGYSATGSIATVCDDFVSTTSSAVPGGSVQGKTVRMGRNTPAGNGGMRVLGPTLGIVTSGQPGFFEFDLMPGGDATLFPPHVEGASTPTLLRAATENDAGKQAVYQMTVDGVVQPTTTQYKINIQPLPELTPALSVASQADINRLPKADLGGKIVEFMDGCGDAFTLGSERPAIAESKASFTGFTTHTGRFTVAMAAGASPLRGGVDITNSARMDVIGLKAEAAVDEVQRWNSILTAADDTVSVPVGHGLANNEIVYILYSTVAGIGGTGFSRQKYYVRDMTATSIKLSTELGGPVVDIPSNGTGTVVRNGHSNFQNRALLSIGGSSDILVDQPQLGAPVGTHVSAWPTGIEIRDSGSLATSQANIAIKRGILRRVKDGVRGGNVDNFFFGSDQDAQPTLIQYYCSNAFFFGGTVTKNSTFRNIQIDTSFDNPADPNDHPDALQFGSTSVKADYTDNLFEKISITMGPLADKVSQGPFPSDVSNSSQAEGSTAVPGVSGIQVGNDNYLTGYRMVRTTFRNIFTQDGTTTSFALCLGDDYLIERCTGMRPQALGLNAAQLTDPTPRASTLTGTANGVEYKSTGIVRDSAFHKADSTNFMGSGWTFQNNVEFNVVNGGGTGLGITGGAATGSAQENARRAFYAPFFADPADTNPATAGAAKLNGALKRPDNTYAGARLPPGTWNNGLAYTG